MRTDKSYKTAISRKKLSAPVKWLKDSGAFSLSSRVLDYGAGHGSDAAFLNFDPKWLGYVEKYDPHYFPIFPTGFFNIVLCTYVLNCLPKSEEQGILDKIKSRLLPGGKAYITVRRDIKQPGYTEKGTYQRDVLLNFPLRMRRKDASQSTYYRNVA